MKNAVAVLVICLILLSGCSSNPAVSSSSEPISSSTESISETTLTSSMSSNPSVTSNGDPDKWQRHTLLIGDVNAEISLPTGMYVEIEETQSFPEAHIMQDALIVPANIYTVGEPESYYYGKTLCRLYFADAAVLDAWKNVGEAGFAFPEDERAFITDTFTYSLSLEEYTYCDWGEYIIYRYPTPGIGGPLPHLVFTHLPTGLTLDFHFSGESISEVVSYYSDIVATIQYSN